MGLYLGVEYWARKPYDHRRFVAVVVHFYICLLEWRSTFIEMFMEFCAFCS